MKIDRIINNNIVSSLDEKGNEVIVMGRGLGFKKKPGEIIDDKIIEKVFHMENKNASDQFKTLLAEIPIEHVRVSNEIIAYARETLGKELHKNIYITLTDHISYAVERYNQGLKLKNPLLWELKKFYLDEYKVGVHALDMIEEQLGIRLEEDEAGSIALHLVNAELSTSMDKTVDMTKVIQGVLNIVKYYYKIDLDEESLNYERFITHLKFFAQRIFTDKMVQNEDTSFYEMVKLQYKDDYKCTEKISDYILNEYGYVLSEEEKVYLTVHIKRVTSDSNIKKE